MRNCFTLGLVGIFLFLCGCASYSANNADNDEQVDLYLSTLDDKHFVWCELDLEQCRNDFEKWKLTPRGRMIIREYEKDGTGKTYNTHHVPNVFRTNFVYESQLAEEVGEQGAGQSVGQDSDALGKTFLSIDEKSDTVLEGISVAPQTYGPEVPSHDGPYSEGHESP